MRSKTLNNEQLFNPLLESGTTLPDIRSVRDATPYIFKDGDMLKYMVAFEGNWLKLNLTRDDVLEIDTIIANNLYAKKFTAKEIRATNGALIVSDEAIIEEVSGDTIYFKDDSGFNVCPFAENDLIIAREINKSTGADIRYVKATVDSVSGNSIVVTYTSTSTFQKGDTVVRIGNTTDIDRQDSLYFTTMDEHSPYFDVYDTIQAFSGNPDVGTNWDTAIPQVRIGKLAGITDADFGTLSGHGIFTENFYGKGSILIDNPEDNGINTVYRQASAPTGDLKVNDVWIDTDDKFVINTWNGSSWVLGIPGIGDSTSGLNINGSYFGYYDGSNWKTYMDNTGNFYLVGAGGGTDGFLQWTASTSTLSIRGSLEILNPEDINTSEINNDEGFITGADAGAKSFYSSTAPTVLGDGLKVGDFWFDTTSGQYRMKRCATITPSVTWSNVGVYMDSSGVYAGTITAGQITTGSLTGQTLTGGTLQTASSGQRVVFGSNKISVYGSTGLGAEIYGSGNYLEIISANQIDLGAPHVSLAGTGDVELYATLGTLNFYSNPNVQSLSYHAGGINCSGDYWANNLKVATQSWVTSQGYLTGYPGAGIAVSTGSAWGTSITDNSANWDAAYGWGDHASAGYAKGTFYPIEDDKFVKYDSSTGALVGTAYNENSFLTSLPSHNNSAHSETYLTSSTEGWRTTDVTGLGNGIGNSAGSLYVKASGGLAFSGGDLVIDYTGAQSASSTTKGFLTSTDWNTFNGKATGAWGTSQGWSSPNNLINLTINGVTYAVAVYIP